MKPLSTMSPMWAAVAAIEAAAIEAGATDTQAGGEVCNVLLMGHASLDPGLVSLANQITSTTPSTISSLTSDSSSGFLQPASQTSVGNGERAGHSAGEGAGEVTGEGTGVSAGEGTDKASELGTGATSSGSGGRPPRNQHESSSGSEFQPGERGGGGGVDSGYEPVGSGMDEPGESGWDAPGSGYVPTDRGSAGTSSTSAGAGAGAGTGTGAGTGAGPGTGSSGELGAAISWVQAQWALVTRPRPMSGAASFDPVALNGDHTSTSTPGSVPGSDADTLTWAYPASIPSGRSSAPGPY